MHLRDRAEHPACIRSHRPGLLRATSGNRQRLQRHKRVVGGRSASPGGVCRRVAGKGGVASGAGHGLGKGLAVGPLDLRPRTLVADGRTWRRRAGGQLLSQTSRARTAAEVGGAAGGHPCRRISHWACTHASPSLRLGPQTHRPVSRRMTRRGLPRAQAGPGRAGRVAGGPSQGGDRLGPEAPP